MRFKIKVFKSTTETGGENIEEERHKTNFSSINGECHYFCALSRNRLFRCGYLVGLHPVASCSRYFGSFWTVYQNGELINEPCGNCAENMRKLSFWSNRLTLFLFFVNLCK